MKSFVSKNYDMHYFTGFLLVFTAVLVPVASYLPKVVPNKLNTRNVRMHHGSALRKYYARPFFPLCAVFAAQIRKIEMTSPPAT